MAMAHRRARRRLRAESALSQADDENAAPPPTRPTPPRRRLTRRPAPAPARLRAPRTPAPRRSGPSRSVLPPSGAPPVGIPSGLLRSFAAARAAEALPGCGTPDAHMSWCRTSGTPALLPRTAEGPAPAAPATGNERHATRSLAVMLDPAPPPPGGGGVFNAPSPFGLPRSPRALTPRQAAALGSPHALGDVPMLLCEQRRWESAATAADAAEAACAAEKRLRGGCGWRDGLAALSSPLGPHSCLDELPPATPLAPPPGAAASLSALAHAHAAALLARNSAGDVAAAAAAVSARPMHYESFGADTKYGFDGEPLFDMDRDSDAD
jgi:hypothetical protein